MTQSAKFWDKIAQRYAKRPVADEAAYQKKLKVTQEYLQADMNVLEFACGTGSTAIIHAPYVKHIRAIDISSKMIEIAKSKAQAENMTNLSFEQATIEDLVLQEESVDVFLGMSILHLLEDKESVLAKLYKTLKPGGYFISSTVCLGDTMSFFKYIGPVGKFLGLMPLVRVFTEEELVNSILAAGFSIKYQWRPDKGKAVFIVAEKGSSS